METAVRTGNGNPPLPLDIEVEFAQRSITEAMQRCLIAIDRGSSAVLSRRGGDYALLCAGEWLPFLSGTVLRLVGLGMLEFSEPTRIRLTPAASAVLDARPGWMRAEP